MQKIIYPLFMYLIFFALTYGNIFVKNKGKLKRNKGVFVLLAAALMFRLLISTYVEGHSTDIMCFKSWAIRLAQLGLQGFYSPDYFADYPPGYMLVLFVIGKLASLFGLEQASGAFTLLIKLPAIFADILLGWVVYSYARERISKSAALVLSSLVALSPVIILVSALWGQIDSVFTLFMLLSLIFVYRKKYYTGAFLYAVCMVIKPQAFLIAPVYMCAYISEKNPKMLAKSLIIGISTVLLAALPFTQNFNFMWLVDKYSATLKSYPYVTVNAYNLYALLGYNWKELSHKVFGLSISVWSYFVIIGVTIGSIWFYIKSKEPAKLFYTAYLITTVMFTFGAKMHERYLFPALFLLIMTFIFTGDKRILFLFIAQSAAHYLNVADVFMDDLHKTGISKGVVAVSSALHIVAAF